jgi:hypothetical protein
MDLKEFPEYLLPYLASIRWRPFLGSFGATGDQFSVSFPFLGVLLVSSIQLTRFSLLASEITYQKLIYLTIILGSASKFVFDRSRYLIYFLVNCARPVLSNVFTSDSNLSSTFMQSVLGFMTHLPMLLTFTGLTLLILNWYDLHYYNILPANKSFLGHKFIKLLDAHK